ncbi:MAG: hypothetical protein J5719_02230 [Bacteroidales bacterium]|nr:hypothetical protein [Bacteroidales bacterium]
MTLRSLRQFDQKFNLHIVKNQERVQKILRLMSIIVSMVTIAAIICYHGFYISPEIKQLIKHIVYFSLSFYIAKYFILFLYSIHKKAYLRNSWFECLVILFLIVSWILIPLLHIDIKLVDYNNFENFFMLFVQIYFLVIVLIEISKVSTFLTRVNMSPPVLMIMSFIILIALGTLLLMLPRMTVNGISFIDALFTATSASCVTGLTVLPTGSAFTFKGHVVIMLLIQIGGLSILSFATFFTAFLSRSYTGLRYQHLVKDLLSVNKYSDAFRLLREIFLATVIIEGIGLALLYVYWRTTGLFDNEGDTFFYAIFHTITAFNNAGFSLWDANLMDPAIKHNYFPQTIIMLLTLLGSIGFLTLRDFFNPQSIRERKKFKWKQLQTGTKIILYTTAIIIVVGSLLFFAVEYNHSLVNEETFFDKVFASVFQFVTGRTAGFNVIDVSMISVPGLLLLVLVMFIGGSPGSTGGGVKVTTTFVIFKSVLATIRGKKNIEFRRQTIPFELVDKAYSIVVMSLLLIFFSMLGLSILEPNVNLATIIFENVAAFSTSGLSTGACAKFCVGSKIILIFNMYIGKLGTLTIAYALSKRTKESRHQYPDTYFMIG